MEITEKNRYMCSVRIKVGEPPLVWVEEANLQRTVVDRIEARYGFRNELEDFDSLAVGIRSIRLLNGEDV